MIHIVPILDPNIYLISRQIARDLSNFKTQNILISS